MLKSAAMAPARPNMPDAISTRPAELELALLDAALPLLDPVDLAVPDDVLEPEADEPPVADAADSDEICDSSAAICAKMVELKVPVMSLSVNLEEKTS